MRRLLLPLVLLAACSSPPDPGPRFNDEGANPDLTCLQHQPAPPGPRYTDPAQRTTPDSLALLRYYTAHKSKPYCDNAPASTVDSVWVDLYVELGGDPTNVADRG